METASIHYEILSYNYGEDQDLIIKRNNINSPLLGFKKFRATKINSIPRTGCNDYIMSFLCNRTTSIVIYTKRFSIGNTKREELRIYRYSIVGNQE